MREIDFIRWEVSLSEKKQLWLCVTKLNNNPEAFFLKSQDLSCNNPKLAPKSTRPQSCCTSVNTTKSLYDKDGYLLPNEKLQYQEPKNFKSYETEYTYIEIEKKEDFSKKLSELFIGNFKKCQSQSSVPSKKKTKNQLQSRPLPLLPQENNDTKSDISEEIDLSPDKLKLFCWSSPTRSYKFDWASSKFLKF